LPLQDIDREWVRRQFDAIDDPDYQGGFVRELRHQMLLSSGASEIEPISMFVTFGATPVVSVEPVADQAARLRIVTSRASGACVVCGIESAACRHRGRSRPQRENTFE
jgi:hypothetical protein